jgi:hypothetical protein
MEKEVVEGLRIKRHGTGRGRGRWKKKGEELEGGRGRDIRAKPALLSHSIIPWMFFSPVQQLPPLQCL